MDQGRNQFAAMFAEAISRIESPPTSATSPRRDEYEVEPVRISPFQASEIARAITENPMPVPKWRAYISPSAGYKNPSVILSVGHFVTITRYNTSLLLFEVLEFAGTEGGITTVFESSIDMKYDSLVAIANGDKPKRGMAVCRSDSGELTLAFGKKRCKGGEFYKLDAVIALQKSTPHQRMTTILKVKNLTK